MEIKTNGEIAWLEFPAGCFILHMDVEEQTDDYGGIIILSKPGVEARLAIFPEWDGEGRMPPAEKCYEVWGKEKGKVWCQSYKVGQESEAIMDFLKCTGHNLLDEVQPGMMVPHNCISMTPGV